MDPEFRERVTISSKLSRSTPEAKAHWSMIQKVVKARPEVKARQVEASREMWQNPTYRAKNAELWQNPEFRAKCESGLRHGAHINKSKTYCLKGHPLSGDNLRINHRGSRECRTCRREISACSARNVRLRKKLQKLGLS